jgi:hypothetical protein
MDMTDEPRQCDEGSGDMRANSSLGGGKAVPEPGCSGTENSLTAIATKRERARFA